MRTEHYADDLGLELEDSFEQDFNAKPGGWQPIRGAQRRISSIHA